MAREKSYAAAHHRGAAGTAPGAAGAATCGGTDEKGAARLWEAAGAAAGAAEAATGRGCSRGSAPGPG
eukprot:2731861-Amphidinium_carterae.1